MVSREPPCWIVAGGGEGEEGEEERAAASDCLVHGELTARKTPHPSPLPQGEGLRRGRVVGGVATVGVGRGRVPGRPLTGFGRRRPNLPLPLERGRMAASASSPGEGKSRAALRGGRGWVGVDARTRSHPGSRPGQAGAGLGYFPGEGRGMDRQPGARAGGGGALGVAPGRFARATRPRLAFPSGLPGW